MEEEESELLELSTDSIKTSGAVFIFSQPLQCSIIIFILLISIVTNCSVIINIINSDIKKSIVTFIIIKNLCIVDLCGACLVLPAPLAATIKGRYPLVSVSRVTVIVRLSWLVSLMISVTVNVAYPCSYEPAAVLCIPILPSGFFFTLFSFICLIFVCLIVGFSATILFLKKQTFKFTIGIVQKQAQIHNTDSTVSRVDYKTLEKNAITTFLVTMSHILLYVPTMLVIGLHGWILPPGAILVCDLFVYSEFLIHPLLLLIASKKMRKEIVRGSKSKLMQLIQRFDEVLYLSRRRMLRKKKKKILENHEKTVTNTISVDTKTLPIADNLAENVIDRKFQPEDEEVERFEKVCAFNPSPSHYSSARESLHSSEYIAVPVRSLSPEFETSCQVQKSSSYLGDLPQLIITNDKVLKRQTDHEEMRVPITFSWPSLEGQVSVHNPSIDSNTTNTEDVGDNGKVINNAGLQNNFHRISSACDSGYSELDICSTAGNILEGANVREHLFQKQQNQRQHSQKENVENQDISYMEELQLYFNLDKMFDKASHEENCFKELDLSICSEDSKDCSCSDYSGSFPATTAKLYNQSSIDSFASANSMTNSSTVISLAQLFSTNTIKNLQDHNVSKKYLERIQNKQTNNNEKVIENATVMPLKHPVRSRVCREDSSRSLPITSPSSSCTNNNKDSLLSDMRRLSLPKVTQLPNDVILLEQSKKSREIFI